MIQRRSRCGPRCGNTWRAEREFFQKHQYDQAEQEYRAALLLDAQNALLYVSLAYTLVQQNKWDDAATAAREALRLNPNSALAHSILGAAQENKGDRQAALWRITARPTRWTPIMRNSSRRTTACRSRLPRRRPHAAPVHYDGSDHGQPLLCHSKTHGAG